MKALVPPVALFAVLMSSPAHSQDSNTSDVQVSLAVGALAVPDYEGSNDFYVAPAPLLTIDWGRVHFQGTSLKVDTLGYDGVVRAGPVAAFRAGRRISLNDDLRGVGNTGHALDLGGYIEVDLGRATLGMTAVHDVTGPGGSHVTVSVSRPFAVTKRLIVVPGLNLSWASDRYMLANFGINAAQSAASGYSQYAPKAGIKDAGATMTAVYGISPHWSVQLYAEYRRLFDRAGASPLVDKVGSRNQLTGFLGIGYRF